MLPPPAHIVTIRADYGGRIDSFSHRIEQYLKRGVKVRIVGECASACTMVTAIPYDKLCVGPDAALEFHQAYYPHKSKPYDASDRSEIGTAILMNHYPKIILDWLAEQGGLTANLIILKGAELRAMFKSCR